MKTNFAACLDVTLDYEGGYSNDAGDPGGPTKYGITIFDVRKYLNPNADADDVKALTLDQAKTIYLKHYWTPVFGDEWPFGLDMSVFDAAVNSGTGRADKWAQYAMNTTVAGYLELARFAQKLNDVPGAIKRYNQKRLGFLQGLSTWRIFGKGWGRRVAGVEAISVKMYLMATSLTEAQVKKKLEDEASAATKSSSNNAKGAGGTVAGGGGGGSVGGSYIDWSGMTMLDWITVGALGVVALVVLWYFLHWMMQHTNRANAYKAEAATLTA